MVTERVKKIAFSLLLILTFLAIFPLSARLADPLATREFNPSIDTRILLLWPDHIELRPISKLDEVSPRPRDAPYTFLIPKDREQWVKDRVRIYPDHAPDAGWIIRIKQLAIDRQRIQLEIMGDGFWGMVYEASPERIVPIGTRLADPAFAFIILAIQVACWGGSWLLVFAARRLFRSGNRTAVTPATSA